MGKPNKKLKKLILTTGIALGVYAGLRYLLPLVIPFFISLGLAKLLLPWSEWLQKRLQLPLGRRRLRLPLGLIGGFLLAGAGILLGSFAWMAGGKLLREGKLLLENLPLLWQKADLLLTGFCRRTEAALHLEPDSVILLARELVRSLAGQAADRIMPYVMGNSMVWMKAAVNGAVLLAVIFFGTVLALQENKEIREYFCRSAFHEEYVQMGRILRVVGAAYGRTQLLILAGTIVICTGGLFLMGNPYYGLLGILIGLFDALPFIGTGTILLPWAAACFLGGKGGQGGVLILIYLLAYLLRQVMESRMMGAKAGLSPFLTLAAIYVGIRLFGIAGVLLGPLGFLIIRESVDA